LKRRKTTKAQRQQKTAKQARWRKRARDGIRVWPVEITPTRFELLVQVGELNPECDDPHEGGHAVERVLDAIDPTPLKH
jgi:hypothetical protein